MTQELFKLHQSHVLHMLLTHYFHPEKEIDVSSVRQYVGETYTHKMQQDAAQFLTDLLHRVDILQTIVQHTLCTRTVCRKCSYVNMSNVTNHVLSIPVDQCLTRTFTMQELLHDALSQRLIVDKECNNCMGMQKTLVKTNVVAPGKVLILHLQLFYTKNGVINKITNCRIKGVPQCNLIIDNFQYVVHDAIFHHGDDISNGRYTCFLRDRNLWNHVNDLHIQRNIWPRNAKDTYIFFTQK